MAGHQLAPRLNKADSVAPRLKTIHGKETRNARAERAEGMRRPRELEDLGYALGIMTGPRTPGRKPD